jgi:hypothetical protein
MNALNKSSEYIPEAGSLPTRLRVLNWTLTTADISYFFIRHCGVSGL